MPFEYFLASLTTVKVRYFAYVHIKLLCLQIVRACVTRYTTFGVKPRT